MEDHQSQNEPPEIPQAESEEDEKHQFESVAEAMRSAKEDATNRAKEAAPKIKSAVADVLYDLSYGGAYGAVFLGAFASELIPKPVRESFSQGAKAGRDTAKKAKDKVCDAMKPKAEEPSGGEVVIDIDPEPAGA
jgi:hypothetical protein